MKLTLSSFVLSVRVMLAPNVFIQAPSNSYYVSIDKNGNVEAWSGNTPRIVKGEWLYPRDYDAESYFLGTLEAEVNGEKIIPTLIKLYPVQKEIVGGML